MSNQLLNSGLQAVCKILISCRSMAKSMRKSPVAPGKTPGPGSYEV